MERRPRKDEANQVSPATTPVVVREPDTGLQSITVSERVSSGNGPQKPSGARKLRLLRRAYHQDATSRNRVDSSSDDDDDNSDELPGAIAVPGPLAAEHDTPRDLEESVWPDNVDSQQPRTPTSAATGDLNVVDATLVDEDELERVRKQAREQAQAEVREEILLNTVTAEQIIPMVDGGKQHGDNATAEKPFYRRYCLPLLVFVLLVVGGVVGGVFAVATKDEEKEPPSMMPSSPPSDNVAESTSTLMPSTFPSTAYTFPNTTCVVDVTISCDSNVLTPQVEPCDDIRVPPFDQCEFDPYEISLRFNGGPCGQSENLADRRPLDSCREFGNISTASGEDEYYLVVHSLDDSVPLSSEYVVAVGDTFTVSTNSVNATVDAPLSLLPSQLQVTIYDNALQLNVLQEISFTTSCTEPRLFLFDRFGSLQYTSLRNEEQGDIPPVVPDDFFLRDISMLLTIKGLGTNRVRLDEANMIVNFSSEVQNFTSRIAGGPLVDRQISLLLDAPYTIDLSNRTRYTAFVTVVGSTSFVNDQGEEEVEICHGFDFYEFIAGISLPDY